MLDELAEESKKLEFFDKQPHILNSEEYRCSKVNLAFEFAKIKDFQLRILYF